MTTAEPRVVYWYRIYCGFMALLYLLCIAGGIALGTSQDSALADPGYVI